MSRRPQPLEIAILLAVLSIGICLWRADDRSATSDGAYVPKSEAERVSPQDQARRHLKGIWHSFEEIQSGVFEVREDLVWNDGKENRHDYFVAFDHERDLMRCDRRGAVRGTRFALNEEELLLQIDSAASFPRIERHPRDHQLDIEDTRLFDYRGIAITSFPAMGHKYEFGHVRKFLEGLDDSSVVEFSDTDDEVRIRFEFACRQIPLIGQHLLVLSRRQGLRLVLFEERYRQHYSHGNDDDWSVESRTETQWMQLNETWVPTRSRVVAPRFGAAVRLSFRWKSVNAPILEETFTILGMDLPEGTQIVNFKSGEPFVEGQIVRPQADAPPN